MLISCSICRDKIFSTHDVIITANCGHLYHKSCYDPWIKTNPTCPTCRSKQRSKAIKVFFTTNEDGTETSEEANHRLKEQYAILNEKLQIVERQAKTITENYESCKEQMLKLEEENYIKTTKVTHLSAVAKSLKSEVKRLKEENAKLERSVKETNTLQRLKVVLEGTHDEVTEMLKNTSCDYNSVQTLCTFVAQLKKCNLREKEKVQDLKILKKQLMDELRSFRCRIDDLTDRLKGSEENKHPVIDIKDKVNDEVEWVDLDESYMPNIEKALGISNKFKVVNQRKCPLHGGDPKVFLKSMDAPLEPQSSAFEYDGMGGSKRSWPSSGVETKPYQRPVMPKKRIMSSIKTRPMSQPQLEDFLINKDW